MFLTKKACVPSTALFCTIFTYVSCPPNSLVPVNLIIFGPAPTISFLKLFFDAVDTCAIGAGFNLHSPVVGFKAVWPLVVKVVRQVVLCLSTLVTGKASFVGARIESIGHI